MDEFAIHNHFENAAARGKDGEFGDVKLELF